MKTYQIELRRTSYINIEVEAENQDDAETLAWQELENHEHEDADANWDMESIELMDIATDETRSYGPQGETA
jgi:hypothetical protein